MLHNIKIERPQTKEPTAYCNQLFFLLLFASREREGRKTNEKENEKKNEKEKVKMTTKAKENENNGMSKQEENINYFITHY